MDSRMKNRELVVLDYLEKHSSDEVSMFLEAIGTRIREGQHFIFVNNDSKTMIQLFDEVDFRLKYSIKGNTHRLEISAEW